MNAHQNKPDPCRDIKDKDCNVNRAKTHFIKNTLQDRQLQFYNVPTHYHY